MILDIDRNTISNFINIKSTFKKNKIKENNLNKNRKKKINNFANICDSLVTSEKKTNRDKYRTILFENIVIKYRFEHEF